MTYRSDLSNPFENNDFGIITGTVVTQFPNVECQLARFMAYSSNIGSFFIGNAASPNLCVWELDAGYDTGWFGVDNLNNLWYRSASGTVDYLAYWIQK
jgi:hypothetical protein